MYVRTYVRMHVCMYVQWNLSKLTTDRSWNSGQHKQVVNLHKCAQNNFHTLILFTANYLLMHLEIAQHINDNSYGQKI